MLSNELTINEQVRLEITGTGQRAVVNAKDHANMAQSVGELHDLRPTLYLLKGRQVLNFQFDCTRPLRTRQRGEDAERGSDPRKRSEPEALKLTDEGDFLRSLLDDDVVAQHHAERHRSRDHVRASISPSPSAQARPRAATKTDQ